MSFIKDQTLESTEGEHAEYLAVILRQGKLLLQANSAIYSWDEVPAQFDSLAFLEGLHNRMDEGSCLITNRLAYTTKDRYESELYFEEVFKKIFPNAGLIDVQSNLMLFSDKRFIVQY